MMARVVGCVQSDYSLELEPRLDWPIALHVHELVQHSRPQAELDAWQTVQSPVQPC